MSVLVTSGASTREQSLKCLERLPKMSPMMTQLLARLARRNCEVPEVTSIVEKDTLLSAQVLRLANSAAFGRAQPINSVRHAIAMVGVGSIRKFALGSSISNLFSRFRTAPSFSLTRFNLHSVGVATMVELLSGELSMAFSEGAFIAGLLHDVGKLLIAASMPKQYEDILALNAVNRSPLVECEREVLGTDHAELSGLAVARWELAEPVRWAAFYHHAPAEAMAVEQTARGQLGLSLVVNKADIFINSLGMSVLPATPVAQEPASLDFEGFSYSQERLLKRFELEWKSLAEMFH
jgi:HD-like signal output (HDOD) protein